MYKKRILAMIMAVAMTLSIVAGVDFTVKADVTSVIQTMLAGSEQIGQATSSAEITIEYTPESDGYYCFASIAASGDPYATLYDAEGNEIASNDNGDEDLFGYNFAIICYLEGGKTYTLKCAANTTSAMYTVRAGDASAYLTEVVEVSATDSKIEAGVGDSVTLTTDLTAKTYLYSSLVKSTFNEEEFALTEEDLTNITWYRATPGDADAESVSTNATYTIDSLASDDFYDGSEETYFYYVVEYSSVTCTGYVYIYNSDTEEETTTEATTEEVTTEATTEEVTTEATTEEVTTEATSEEVTTEAAAAVAVGTTETVGNFNYKVTAVASDSEVGTVTLTGVAKKTKNVVVPATVTLSDGKTYNVTAIGAKAFKGNKTVTKVTIGKNVTTIGAKAFYGCKKLKTIIIKSKKLKKVGKKAIKGIKKSATIKVPKTKLKAYKKLFKSKTGFKKTMKIKKK